MPVGAHEQRASVFVANPSRNRRNVHSFFDTTGHEPMPQVVMGEVLDFQVGTCAIEWLANEFHLGNWPVARRRLERLQELTGICFLARALVMSAAGVKENCFSLSFIPAPSCQGWWRASTGKSCRFSGGFARSATERAGGSSERPGNAREAARFRGKPRRRRPVPGRSPPSNRSVNPLF